MSDELLTVDNLRVAYGKVEAVHGVSIRVRKGEIVTVIGPNGAGKSTLLNALAGLLPYEGTVSFAGSKLDGTSTEARVSGGLTLVPEKRELFSSMTVEDNLILGAFKRYIRRDRSIRDSLGDVYSRFPRLADRRQQQAGTLSGGERQMLALGRALMAKPALLMLDEPSLGLAPIVVREIFQIIRELRSTGVSILLIEQNARAALQLADYGYVLETGNLVMEGVRSSLENDPRVIETYLGLAGKRSATAALASNSSALA